MNDDSNRPPRWVELIGSINAYLSQDLFGGSKVIKMAWVINLHKALTLLFVALLMLSYQNFSTVTWAYLALHGTYGVCWLLKHLTFPDAKWEVRITFAAAVFTFLLLGTYWIAPFLLVSQILNSEHTVPADWFIAVCISLHTLGLVIMTSSDCQKHFSLQYQRTLIVDGMFKYVRHPNYLGEMMVYSSYALLVQHWIPWIVLAYWWTMVFAVNMRRIEASLSRYPEWPRYKARTRMLFPRFSSRLSL